MKEDAQLEIKYYIANFGEAYAVTHPVDGGHYMVPDCYSDAQILSVGNVMLLCCWAGHKGLYKGDAWGIGKVTGKKPTNDEYDIEYKYRRLIPEIGNDDIYNCLKAEGKAQRFRMGAASRPNWLFRIQASTFLSILSC